MVRLAMRRFIEDGMNEKVFGRLVFLAPVLGMLTGVDSLFSGAVILLYMSLLLYSLNVEEAPILRDKIQQDHYKYIPRYATLVLIFLFVLGDQVMVVGTHYITYGMIGPGAQIIMIFSLVVFYLYPKALGNVRCHQTS